MRIKQIRNVIMSFGFGCIGPALAWAQPTINTQPTNQTVLAGGSATFALAVSGAGPFTYQWRLNGTNLANLITTVAGTGTNVYSGDGRAATNAALNGPAGVAVDGLGNLFISDSSNNRIRKVDTNGIIITVAGKGTVGYSGDGGPATNAQLAIPQGAAVDVLGNLFIADFVNYSVRKVRTNGIITTVAGNGTQGYSGDRGPATSAVLNSPESVAVDKFGNLFIADSGNNNIRKVDTNGVITTVAGRGTAAGYSGDGGPATDALLNQPQGVAVDGFGNLFISDSANNHIRKVGTNGIITTVPNVGGGTTIAVDGFGNLYIADFALVRKLGTNGIITTVAGKPVGALAGYSGDGGPATNALLNLSLSGLAVDGSGNLFIADQRNNRIRKVADEPFTLSSIGSKNAGNYDVVITSPSGSVTSLVAVLTVVQPLSLTATTSNASNLLLALTGTAGQTYILQTATSLGPPINWQPVFTNAADGSGNWTFTNSILSAQPAVFYRVAEP